MQPCIRRIFRTNHSQHWRYLVLAAASLSSCDIHERTLDIEASGAGRGSTSFAERSGGNANTSSASPSTQAGGSSSVTNITATDTSTNVPIGGSAMAGATGMAGGTASGGIGDVVFTGGAAPSGGTTSTGAASSNGGAAVPSDGGSTASPGTGVATGGVGIGGAPAAGGVATGGVATGGVATGGVATGGAATGGVATGGAATGGMASCLIGTAPYLPGTQDPTNECQYCRPEVAPQSWTSRTDGTPCQKTGEICVTGKCTRGCFIGKAYYEENAFELGNQCRSCQPALSTAQWSNVPNRTGCGANQICYAGECKSGCYIAGTFYEPNKVNPSNPCQSCQVAKSLDSWSTLDSANGTTCDVGKVCRSGVCAAACYIDSKFYSPDDNDTASPCGRCIPTKKTDGWSLRNECFKSLALGGSHSCALVDTETIWCWGRNHLRQLGDEAGQDSTKPVKVVNSVRSTAIAAGSAHTCAIRDQLVLCWGGNSSGQLGNGTLSQSQSLPAKVLDLTQASAVAAGNLHSCALDAVGAIRCWGDNQSGQLGSGSSELNSARPMSVVGVDGSTDASTAIAVSAGGAHSCALMLGGSVMCWGKNNAGQLGNGTNQDQRSPVTVHNLTDAVAIATGYTHSCAVLTSGGVKCWGSNTSGELGDGTTTPSSLPVQIGAAYIDNATNITAGQSFTCARLKTGALKCWGNDGSDQLGNGAGGSNTQTTPVAVLKVSTAIVAGAGASHACAGLAGGGLQCWGDNAYGQLGDGSKSDQDEPTSVLGF